MTSTITLNLAKTNNTNAKTFSIRTENKSLLNAIVGDIKNETITEAQMHRLQEVAGRNGDAGILESCDLGGAEKINLAKMNGFSQYYDISLSDDKKYFKVKIKDAGALCKNPNLATIKADFGLRDGVLVQKGKIPHGNDGVIPSSTGGGGFDGVELKVGKEINIPVSEINITGSPRGAVARFCSWLSN